MALPAVRPCRPFLRPRGDGRQTRRQAQPFGAQEKQRIAGKAKDWQTKAEGLRGSAIRPFPSSAAATVSGVVPELSTWAMLLLGFAGLGYAGYRRAKTSPAKLAA